MKKGSSVGQKQYKSVTLLPTGNACCWVLAVAV